MHDAIETVKRFLTKEKIDRQMTGQGSTPFMKLSDKKRKSVTFETKEALEKTSENMERMTVLIDKMYIKLKQKDVLISLRYIKEVEDRIRDRLVEEIIGEEIGPSVEIIMKAIEDMDVVEVIFRRGNFQGRSNFRGRYNNRKIEVGKIEIMETTRS